MRSRRARRRGVSRAVSSLGFAWLSAALLCASPLRAQGAADAQSQAVREALEHERAGEPAEALGAWRRAEALDPASRQARRARTRRQWLEARGEGDFMPLASLMAWQALDEDARTARLDSFAREVELFPDGRVRTEARLALAAARAERGDTRGALAGYARLADDTHLDEDERVLVQEDVARTYARAGRESEAIATLEALGEAHEGGAEIYRRQARRRWLEPLSWILVGAFIALAIAAIARSGRGRQAARRALSGAPLVLALWLAVVPAWIAASYGDDSTAAFRMLGPASGATLLLSFACGEAMAQMRPSLRALLAGLAASSVVATGYLSASYFGEALALG